MLSDRQIVELFHLQFVRLLGSGPDKDRFAIKGGCNLRFFFESIRYSDDIDIDVTRTPVHTLKEKVSRILEGPALVLPLRSRGVSVREISAPKQTDTTQRWKVGLAAEGRSLPLHTKIEFLHRNTTEEAKVEPIASSVLADYQLMPQLARHYPLAAALRQKVGALTGRSTVQARDVFDLAVLLAKAGGETSCPRPGSQGDRAGEGRLLRGLQVPSGLLFEDRACRRIRQAGGLGRFAGAGRRTVGKGPLMNAPEALRRLKGLRVPAATTADAAAILGVSGEAASHTMRRLAKSGLVTPMRKGLWALAERPDPLVLTEYVTAPYPSYVSLQTALYQHGMIDQIPSMIFVVSLARSARIETGLGTYSVHHVQPGFFDGFQSLPDSGIKLALPEKALVDVLYLSPTRARLFAALPEVELPRGFRRSAAREWVRRIPSRRLRTIVANRLEEALARSR